MTPEITVLGSINIDLVVRCSQRPKPGETVFGRDHQFIPGGKGANQAFAAVQLGGHVSLIGCIGSDSLAETIITSLSTVGIDLSAVKTSKELPTGAAFITLDDQGENTIVYSPSANGAVTAEYIREQEKLIKRSDLLISQCEVPLAAVEESVQLARSHGAKTMLNLAPCTPINHDSPIWQATILVVNEIEAEYYTEIHIASQKDALRAARKLLDRGAEIAIVTLGGEGSVAAARDGVYSSQAVAAQVVDTTAAGDTYIGAFGVEWIKSGDIQRAMNFSSHAAGITVSKLGAQLSIPAEDAVRSSMGQNNKKEAVES